MMLKTLQPAAEDDADDANDENVEEYFCVHVEAA